MMCWMVLKKWLYQGSKEEYFKICEEFHRMYGALSSHKEEWENLGEQLLMFFVYTYFCGAVYDDMVCSKLELALFSVRWIQEFFDRPLDGKWKKTVHAGCGGTLLAVREGDRALR